MAVDTEGTIVEDVESDVGAWPTHDVHRLSWLGANMEVLKVSSKSSPNAVAGAMASVLRQTGAVEVQVVGAGALNQAVKAMAIARGFVVSSGIDLVCVPNFADIEIDGQSRTALRLLVEHRGGAGQVPPAGEDGEAISIAQQPD